MDKIKVTLENYTPIDVPIHAIAKPYRNQNPSMQLVKTIMDSGHTSTIEHIVFHFSIEGVSRALLQEFSRHRMASETVESTRYCLIKSLKEITPGNQNELLLYFVIPELFNKFDVLKVTYSKLMDTCVQTIKTMNEYMKQLKTTGEIDNDIRITDYLKYCLPESFRTNIYWTINLRSLKNFLALRSSKGAHFEIRYLAKAIYDEVMKTEYAILLDKME